MAGQQRVTGQDVAERAGVSRATVSYVLNDVVSQPISAETRSRVLAAAAELGYTPHAAARQLRTGVSDVALLALPSAPPSHAMSLCIAASTERLSTLGYTALLDPASNEVADLDRVLARLQPVAVVASGPFLTPPLVARLRAAGTRAVLALNDRPVDGVPTIVLDQAAVTRVAMTHLAARGHRSVVALMPADPTFDWFRAGRQAGAEQVAEQHDISLAIVESVLDHDLVAETVARALSMQPPPDAILAYNDDYALLALRALIDAGVEVPGQVAVIGCDNLPVAELFTPRLTSVDIEARSLGMLIADSVHQILSTGDAPAIIAMPTPVVVARDSA